MTQNERREYLIKYLLKESNQYANMEVPATEDEKKQLLRALFNVRMPKEASEKFIRIQDEYLIEENKEKGITDYKDLMPIKNGIYL